ncbi:MAG TPA: flagellar type III secretion system protein FlhB [Janthinobacterium sp.]|nr:flagellar type III secretion system protein FlhB [Janthinobacterium sp.]
MADSDTSAEAGAGAKTEKASRQKLRKARAEGQVVRSRDLSTALGILFSLKLLVWLLPTYLLDFRALFALCFDALNADAMADAVGGALALLVKMVLPLFVVPLSIVLGSLVPGGWVLSTGHWAPRMERLSPAKNLGRLFSPKHGFEFAIALAKAAVLGAVLLHVSRSSLRQYLQLQRQPLPEAMAQGAGLMLDGLMALCAVFMLFAVIDVPAQVFFFARGQRMSKQDLKEEHKSSEGRPEVRQRMRQLQQQMARRGLRKTVPTADVVIVNPEHYAVALKYDEGRAEAPFVVAKGIDEMALYIRQLATEHGIVTLELAPLARAIYNTSQLRQQIPVQLYQAVSQVLNYVLQLKAFRTGQRSARPPYPSEVVVPPHLSEVAPP